MIMKLDLTKPYDKVNWDFLRLVLLQIGIADLVLTWIMAWEEEECGSSGDGSEGTMSGGTDLSTA